MEHWQIIVLLGGLILVYAYLIPKTATFNPRLEMMKEIEETFEQFAAELNEENQEIIKMITEHKRMADANIARLTGRLESLESQMQAGSKPLEALAAYQQLEPQQIPYSSDVTHSSASMQIQNQSSSQLKESVDSAELAAIAADDDHSILLAKRLNLEERYQDIFQYYMQGKSIEYIAKKLGMNKGEIQLIIQLARQEEQLRA